MTTTNNFIPNTFIDTNNRTRTIVVDLVLGVGAATLATSAVHGDSAPAHDVHPAAVYSELAPLADWAGAHGLTGLSPASLRPATEGATS